jgi:hypothetical protein
MMGRRRTARISCGTRFYGPLLDSRIGALEIRLVSNRAIGAGPILRDSGPWRAGGKSLVLIAMRLVIDVAAAGALITCQDIPFPFTMPNYGRGNAHADRRQTAILPGVDAAPISAL